LYGLTGQTARLGKVPKIPPSPVKPLGTACPGALPIAQPAVSSLHWRNVYNCKQVYNTDDMICAADAKLCSSMCTVHHCISYLLPEVKTFDYSLRKRDHHLELPPSWHYSLFRNSFVLRCLFKFKWTVVMSLSIFACTVRLLYANKYTYIHTSTAEFALRPTAGWCHLANLISWS